MVTQTRKLFVDVFIDMSEMKFALVVFSLITVVSSLDTVTLTPDKVTILINSNAIFTCNTSISDWENIQFGINDAPSFAIFVKSGVTCGIGYIDASRYSAQECALGKPFVITIHNYTDYLTQRISCKVKKKNIPVADAINATSIINIRIPLQNVTLKPDNQITMKEGSELVFLCSARSIPKANISWHIGVSSLTIIFSSFNGTVDTNTSIITYMAQRTDNAKSLYCTADDSSTKRNSTVAVMNITYVPEVHVNPEYNPYMLYIGQQDIVLTCVVIDANPITGIIFTWTKQEWVNNQENVTISSVTKTTEGEYSCTAKNSIGTSNKTSTKIEVQYGPVISDMADLNIVEGNTLNQMCTIDANPAPLFIWWTRQNDAKFQYMGQNLKIDAINRTFTDTYSCHVQNTLTPSGLEQQNKTTNNSFSVNVYYIPKIHVTPLFEPLILYKGQNNVSLTCEVDDANPMIITNYTWNSSQGTSYGKTLQISNVDLMHSGVVSCTAHNIAGASVPATRQVDVQYGPVISNLTNMIVVEGDTLIVSCNIDSNPPPLFVWWSRQNDSGFQQNGTTLKIVGVTRRFSDIYSCHAQNILTPTELEQQYKTAESSFFVNIHYRPEVHITPIFAPFIVYKGQHNVILTCEVEDANPLIITSYTWNSSLGTSFNKTLTILTIDVMHAGKLSCTAQNSAGVSAPATKQVVVQYDPVIMNITNMNIVENNTLNVTCSIKANPTPTVWWTRQKDSSFRQIGTTLNIVGLKREFSDNFSCHAQNTITPSGMEQQNSTAETSFSVNVQYPPSVLIEGPDTVAENDTLSLACQVRDANPNVSNLMWYKNDKWIGNNSILSFNKVAKMDAGVYKCIASNGVLNGGIYTKTLYILYGPEITNLTVLGGSKVTENSTVSFRCDIDSNPYSNVEWEFLEKRTEVFNDIRTNISNFNISKAGCFDTGYYQCTATNYIKNKTHTKSERTQLLVTCSPRLNKAYEQPHSRIGLTIGQNLNISVPFVAYPPPHKVAWSFQRNGTNNQTSISANFTITDLFKHVTCVYITNLTIFEFGDYILKIDNNIGLEMIAVYNVVPQGPPEASKLENVTCTVLQVDIIWMTTFNGGDAQHFYINVTGSNGISHYYKTNETDDSLGSKKTYRLDLPKGFYSFRIYGTNNFGNASSDELKCQITDSGFQDQQENSMIGIAAGIGSTAAACLIIAALCIIVVIKRRLAPKKGGDENGRQTLTTFIIKDEDDDGVKDNILYESSSPYFKRKDEYAAVQLKVDRIHFTEQTVVAETSLHSDMKKTLNADILDKVGGNNTKPTKDKSKGKGKHKQEDVYENVDNGYGNRNNLNKDGLQYAELVFNPSLKGGKFIIHGLEDKTIYAEVDTSQKIDPLPESDEEKGDTNSRTFRDDLE